MNIFSNNKFFIVSCLVLIFSANTSFSQPNYNAILGQDKLNAVTTSVPFLLIAPDARGGALGDAGVASSPDANSMHYNPAKFAFIENDFGVAMSYSPWLRGLVNDISLAYLSGYRKLGDDQAVGVSLRYFSLGDIIFTDKVGETIGQFRPNEFALDVTYARKFSEKIGGAVSLRYINSNLTGGIFVNGAQSNPGQSIATDVAMFYQTDMRVDNMPGKFAFGINVSNIGSKISYTENLDKDFIPINLKFGPAFTLDFDQYNSLTFMIEVNKLLVPTPPVYARDSLGRPIIDNDGNYEIARGKDPNRSVVSGMFSSFSDAPDGFEEEMKEFNYAIGLEYWYDKQFAIRTGFFYEHPHKGNRKFFTIGAGFKMNVFGLDFSYLVPLIQKHPLENTLRFTLTFDFEAFKELGQ
jgi:hypothetical protein